MIKLKLIFGFVMLGFFSCGTNDKGRNKTLDIREKGFVKTLNYEGLKPLLHKKGNKTYVVNFWATWCKPCVDELPYFEKIHQEFVDKNVEVLLVSLDFPRQLEEQLIPFINKNNIQSEVVVLDDPNQNKWIDAIDKSWSGALPATIIYNQEKRVFYEKSFEEGELLEELHKFIN